MSNMYGFGEDQLKSTNTPFPVGVGVDNVEITDCTYVESEEGKSPHWEAIEVTYQRGAAMIKDRMFAVNPDNVNVRPWVEGDTVDAAIENAVKTYNTQLYHVASKLDITKEQLSKCRTKSFRTLAEDYCKLILANCKGVKLYLKTTKDKKYTRVGRSTGSTMPYLQNMSEGACTLEYSKKEQLDIIANSAPQNGVVGQTSGATQWMPEKTI